MINGIVSDDGVPEVELVIAGSTWRAIVDTGFNGDLELPQELASSLNAKYVGRVSAFLAANQRIEEDLFVVEVPFDDQVIHAQATFNDGREILLGTNLLHGHRLIVDFPGRTVLIERVQ